MPLILINLLWSENLTSVPANPGFTEKIPARGDISERGCGMALDYQPIYILASGMLLQERKLAVVANNLANASTPSFKRDLLLSGSWYADMGDQIPDTSADNPTNNFVYPLTEAVVTLLTQGSLRETGNPLDVAIEGDGFFAVRTDQGVLFTRKGNFALDSEGYLVTEEGYRLLDRNGREIRLQTGSVRFGSSGEIYVDGQLIGTLGIWTLQNPEKAGFDYFTGTALPADNFRILQGFIETSNVNPVEEMVRLIETSRAHEAYTRLVQAVDEVQGKVNSLIR